MCTFPSTVDYDSSPWNPARNMADRNGIPGSGISLLQPWPLKWLLLGCGRCEPYVCFLVLPSLSLFLQFCLRKYLMCKENERIYISTQEMHNVIILSYDFFISSCSIMLCYKFFIKYQWYDAGTNMRGKTKGNGVRGSKGGIPTSTKQ